MPQTGSRVSKKKKVVWTKKSADRHVLYQMAVQNPESEIDFVDRTFKRVRGRTASVIREDFCGTAYSSCEWVRRRKTNRAIGVDLHLPTLRWGERHNLSKLTEEQRARILLLNRDVMDVGREGRGVDAVLAMNFSWFYMTERRALVAYFKSVRESLVGDGVFFMDIYGGYEATKEQVEKRREKGFKYVWDQAKYDPISGMQTAHIHFEFERGPALRRAFTYTWRVYSVPEVRDALDDAGFGRVTVYWEGDDGKGGGNGVFRPAAKGEACASFVSYVVAEK
jgi:hypothetical protein